MPTSGLDHSTLPTGFAFLETGSEGNNLYATDNGSNATGNTYSYGTGTSSDRALGELTSGTVQSTIGACFVNDTDHVISTFLISYAGEQWSLGAADGLPDKLDFQYSIDATSLATSTFTWTNVNGLDFNSPATTGVGPKDGNAGGNRTVFSPFPITQPGGILPEAVIFIRWTPVVIPGTNTNDALAIDDFTIATALAAGLAGDYSNNSEADAADYVVWRNRLGHSINIPNDITPGSVVAQDWNEWKQRFGKKELGTAAFAPGPVPEPTGLLLCALGTFVVLLRRCDSRRQNS